MQTNPITWKRVSQETYWEMLEVLPPECMTGLGFLVGEPVDHNAEGQPRFEAFAEKGDSYFVADRPLTVAEFRAVQPQEVC